MEEMKEQLKQYNLDELYILSSHITNLIWQKRTENETKALKEVIGILEKNAKILEDTEIIFDYGNIKIDEIITGFNRTLSRM